MSALDRLFALEHHGIKLGLENIRLLLDAMGRPQDAWPSIHIAGTNGKGSVTAMVERALRAAGHHTGRYTSPHLSRIEERVAIDGGAIDEATFADLTGEVLIVVDRLINDGVLAVTPTFFEVTTAIAFQAFKRARVSVGVVEVGLGGQFDATNILTPAVCAITSIALDHQRYLGTSIGEIAYEKAGIIKQDMPVVIGQVPPEAHEVIARVAKERNARLIDAGAAVVSSTLDSGRATISVHTGHDVYDDVRVGLNGVHQRENAVSAIHVLEAADARGIRVDRDAIITGVEDAYWPARLEWLALPAPLAPSDVEGSERERVEGSEHRVLLDAAHNPAGARAVASYLASIGAAPLPIVLAVMRDKDVAGIVTALAPFASVFVATETGTDRSMGVDDLAQTIASVIPKAIVECHPSKEKAATAAFARAPAILVAGSIFLVGPLREWLLARGFTHCADAP